MGRCKGMARGIMVVVVVVVVEVEDEVGKEEEAEAEEEEELVDDVVIGDTDLLRFSLFR